MWVPPGATATADDATGMVTVKSQAPDAFLVSDVGQTPIVCGNGMKDRSTLKEGADGTGMYTLTSAVPGSSYTLTLRKGYTWGRGRRHAPPPRACPPRSRLKVVTNMTTAANELLAGQANIGEVVGSDTQRLTSLYSQSIYAPLGELWFNEKPGQPHRRRRRPQGADPGGPAQPARPGAQQRGRQARHRPCRPRAQPVQGQHVGSNLPAYTWTPPSPRWQARS